MEAAGSWKAAEEVAKEPAVTAKLRGCLFGLGITEEEVSADELLSTLLDSFT